MSQGDFQAAVRFTEERLRMLSQKLDGSFDFHKGQAGAIGLLFGFRARSLFLATLHALAGPSEAAVRILLRSLADLAITIAWVRLNPDLHAELWEAELARNQIRLMEARIEWRGYRPELAQITEEEADMQAQRAVVAAARERGGQAGVPGIGRGSKDPVLPTLAQRAKQVGTPAAREAYEILVAWLSEWTHSGKGSFGMVGSQQEALRIEERGADPNDYQMRSLGAVLFAFALGEVSRWLDLGIERECDTLRAGLTARWSWMGPASSD